MVFKVHGKTTTAGKIANLLRKEGKKPLLVAGDIYRPAAIDQLESIANSMNMPIYLNRDEKNVTRIAQQAINYAKSNLNNVIILDTAGRLEVDEVLMQELKDIEKNIKPDNVFLVVDSMTGQVAADVAKKFDEDINLTGIVLTKLDADSRRRSSIISKKDNR